MPATEGIRTFHLEHLTIEDRLHRASIKINGMDGTYLVEENVYAAMPRLGFLLNLFKFVLYQVLDLPSIGRV
jgi:hypothetical protein